MNGRKAKALRKHAIVLTGGPKPRSYVLHDNGMKVGGEVRSGSIRLDPSCTRATYQRLKRISP